MTCRVGFSLRLASASLFVAAAMAQTPPALPSSPQPAGPLPSSTRDLSKERGAAGGIQVGGGAPLRLDDLLAAVEKTYPPLIAAFQERALADADVLNAESRFDMTFRTRLDSDNFGFYANRRVDAIIEQPTAFQGLTLNGGWRYGDGSFAPYDGKLATRTLGEFATGFRLPLFRDRAIDNRRADLAKAQIGRQLAGLSIDQQKLVIVQNATRRYWDWVAAGQRYLVVRDVLDIALAREVILEEAVRNGALPAIDVTDNKRIILSRRAQLVEAQRALEQSAIELSLFYRDASANPVMPKPEQVPVVFPDARSLDSDKTMADLKLALGRRPEIERFDAQEDQAEIDKKLAANQRMPNIDLTGAVTSLAGEINGVRRGPQEVRAGVIFELPFQRRAATARLRNAEARIKQIEQRRQFARDQVTAEVQDSVSAVQAAFNRVEVTREEVDTTRAVEDAERVKYQLGESTLFTLNLREQQTLEAALRVITAQADYHRAMALYQYAVAEILGPRP